MNSSGYVKTKRGNVFHPSTGKLFIFDDNSVSVLRGWPVMRAWKKTCVKHPNWIGFRPSLSWLEVELNGAEEKMEAYRRSIEDGQLELSLSFRYRQDGNPYRSDFSKWYFETTPPEIRRLLKPFRKNKWSLMAYLAAGGTPAEELLQAAPAIAFMLANNRIFHTPTVTKPMRTIRTWLQAGKNRKDLLRWLGFPPTKSMIHLLGKVPRQDISIYALLKIRTIVQNPEWFKMLRYQPIIDRAVLSFFEPDMREMLTSKLLSELRSELLDNLTSSSFEFSGRREEEKTKLTTVWKKTEQPIWLLMRDIVRMFRQQNPGVPFPKIQSLNALFRLHDELSESVQREQYDGKTFVPPIPGNEVIAPITDYAMLCEEGHLQHNCVASYAQSVMNGTSFIYRVLSPERCTLELVPRNGKWVTNQLLAACNRPVQNETKEAVAKWLKDNKTLQ